MKLSSWVAWSLTTLFWGFFTGALVAEEALRPEEREFFESRIRPLLVEHCIRCHGPQDRDGQPVEPKGGLRLDSRDGALRGGDTGAALVPGRPEESLLVTAVRYQNVDLQMPPDGKLSERQIQDLERWVAMGAPDPRREAAETRTATAFDLVARRDAHWAWQPLAFPKVPAVRDESWPRDDLDRFILARLEEAGLEPNPEAERRAWLRRISFALTGLAPTPREIEAYLADETKEANRRVVDRLLSSPHFGETWGQHWLDMVRYAESYGHEGDGLIDEAYRYRDYVVQAFNEDVPYDQLIVEHVAGDLLPEPRLDQTDRTNQSIQGTGFWHLGDASHSPVDIRGEEAERIANQIDTFSRTFLGLSMSCARCHDHKFDAISTRDYYAFFGFLQSSGRQYANIADPVQRERAVEALTAVADAHRGRVVSAFRDYRVAQLKELERYLAAALQVSDYASLLRSVEEEGLDETTLVRVFAHLGIAAGEPEHPFHALALLEETDRSLSVTERKVTVAERWQAAIDREQKGLREMRVLKTVKKSERDFETHARPWQPSDVVIDYGRLAAGHWITNGSRFGAGPLPAGRAVLGGSGQPIRGILDGGAAVASVELQKGSGLLRTQTFEVRGDRLWYQVRGNARVFLAVNSHRVVTGPLHGVVKKRMAGSFDRWRWESQRVLDYHGHRVHIEFYPEGDFAVRRVLFADTPPPESFDTPEPLRDSVVEAPDFSPSTLASRITGALVAVAGGLGRDGLELADADEEELARRSRLLDWLVQNGRILPTGGATLEPLAVALADAHAAYTETRLATEELMPPVERALALLDGTGENEPVHIRGNHRTTSADLVPRRFLEAVVGEEAVRSRGSGRLQLARTLVDGSTPLVPRVFANRVWHHLFGRGIVETVDDFGIMGTKPSHPELLEHLSQRLVAGGWSIKGLIRHIVLSRTYSMSSRPQEDGERVDPANLLLHRMPIQRLRAEAIRDHILAVSGRLDRTVGGPSVTVYISEHLRNNRSPREQGPIDGGGRRSIYIQVRRNHVSSMLVAFDRPVPILSIGKRSVSNAPAQPLILLNDPFIHEQAALWAKRLLANEEASTEERLRDAYVNAYARLPSEEEVAATKEFLADQASRYEESGEERPEERAWADLCHTLMNVKEFFFVN